MKGNASKRGELRTGIHLKKSEIQSSRKRKGVQRASGVFYGLNILPPLGMLPKILQKMLNQGKRGYASF